MKKYEDILDSKKEDNNIKLNFLTHEPYSDNFYKLADKWSKLPIYSNKKTTEEFFNLVNTKQVILLTSGTGSGKTVLIPKFLLKYAINNNISGKIAITNPKILSTKANAVYAAQTLDVELGNEVGFKYKNSPAKFNSDKTKLLYLTDGTLRSIIINLDNNLSEYCGVIIDEAHERHIQIDLVLKLLKDIVTKREDFKLIIMSATINASVFRDYFNTDTIKYGELDIYKSPNYNIEHIWLNKDINIHNYLESSINICNNILKNIKKEDIDTNSILVFVPTVNDTFKGCQLITDENKKLYCIEVSAKTTDTNREIAIDKDLYKSQGEYNNKIIFATNVAESSITFDGLKYVVDTGLELVNEFDSYFNMNIVKKDYITQAQVKQRIGRTGRTGPGTAYHLYTEKKFNSLEEFPKPSILTSDITDIILSLIKYYDTINECLKSTNDLITPPSKYQINNSLHKLKFIKCLKMNKDNTNGTITRIGKMILKFKSGDILSILAIIMGYFLKCQREIIIIMSIIEITEGNIDLLINKKFKKNISMFKKYSYLNSDHITALNIYNANLIEENKQYFNKELIKKINRQIKIYSYHAKSFKSKQYKYINKKYKLIDIEIYDNIVDNIIYVLSQSHKYNLIKDNKSINFINNSTASVVFSPITKYDNLKGNLIFNNLINRFGRKVFQCITKIY